MFSIFGVELTQASQKVNYINTKETVKKAAKAGLSVCDYVEKIWKQEGETDRVIKNMENLGVFSVTSPNICEIGAGTGRYMGKVIKICNPRSYESYEASKDWANWLQSEYPIKSQPTDGKSLKSTENKSIDILQAHGVFVYIPFFDSLRYFNEIDRVTQNGSFIVFDCITEDCLDEKSLNDWINSDYNYPCLLTENYIFNCFPSMKYELLGTFFTKYGQGKSKYFVFKKFG